MARGGALFASYRFRSLPCRVRAFQVASCPLRLKANQFSSVSIQCERFLSFPSRFLAVSQRRISHRFDSISLLCHAWRIVALLCLCASVRAWPCESDSNRRVASGRPSFPPLRRSPPIPSLPWLLAADLFRGCSAQLEALPCHSAASRCTSISSHRCFAVSLAVDSKLCCAISLLRFRGICTPRSAVASPFTSWPCLSTAHCVASVQLRTISKPFCSSHLRCCPCRIVWPRRHSTAIRIVSRPFAAFSIRLIASLIFSISQHLTSMPFRFISFAVAAIAVPIRAFPGSSVPSPVFSGRCHAIARQLIAVRSVHGHSSAHPRISVHSHALANQGKSNPLPLWSWR